MKYVIFKHRNLFMPVIFPDCITHSQIKITGAEPISAGFFSVCPSYFGSINTYGKSESLKLEPHERDSKLLWSTLHNPTSTNAFLDWENL